jgi:[ribosomal protein S5]-alanine N-acetyltransferase
MTAPAHPQLTGLPVLETERLTLRAPQAGDWPTFRAYRMSADRTAFTGGPKKEHEAAQQFAGFFGHWVLRGFGRLMIEDRATGQAIGHVGPMQWADDGDVELTWSLWTAAAEGRGLAQEAARAMQDWVFGPLGVTAATAEIHRDNAPSHAIARHLGGQVIPDRSPVWFDVGSVYRFAPGVAA